jgi:hypothetical protein
LADALPFCMGRTAIFPADDSMTKSSSFTFVVRQK